LLLQAVTHTNPDLKMPPRKPRLPAAAIADLRNWIRRGAPDPRHDPPPGVSAVSRADRHFWAYQPPRDPDLPTVDDDSWPRQTIDHFVLAALGKQKLNPSPDADLQSLVRRLHFDLVGLPPAPSVVAAFVQRVSRDGLDQTLSVEVDRLLSSPQFGERWGRHWLDVARFGESSGQDANISFPYAWRYRDYVIDSLNQDVPYNRFLVEQLAGDLLPYRSPHERARRLIATGFLALGTKNLAEMNPVQFQADIVDEQIDTVSRAILGSSLACARCHDHKFDAFSMRDYYALAGIFASTKTFFGTAVSPGNRVGGDPLPLPLAADEPIFHKSIPAVRVRKLETEMETLRGEQRAGQAAVRQAIADGTDPSSAFPLRAALRIFWRLGAIEGQLEKVDDSGRALPLASGVLDRSRCGDVPLLTRGDVTQPADTVPRGFPQVLNFGHNVVIPKRDSGRRQLAEWLTHPRHPLTARVMVNRIWKHVFGAGLVSTTDDFGATGKPPSHPALLDHLALRFIAHNWSVKRMVRELVLSRTYRQAATYRAVAFQRDPHNRLLWRMSKRRLEAEAIRDAMLAVSGELDLSRPQASLVGRVIGDRPISIIGLDKRLPPDLDGAVHRSVYLPVIRDRVPDVLDLFDFADSSFVTGSRENTNVPTQALYLMNSPFVQQRSVALANRVRQESGPSPHARVRRAFRLCCSRPPAPDELSRALEFLVSEPASSDDAPGSQPRIDPLTRFCQALLCTAEFRNLD
ncbi:MAG: DUF1549 and DUF1553 domain-containing protein, partial [Planctomycetaceae bacterium]